MYWVKNQWYVAAWSHEVSRAMIARSFFGEGAVLFRTVDGAPVMLSDRCAHKGAPLSLGTLSGDNVVCPYHGLEYDVSGQCVRVPSQQSIPPRAKVQSFPCVERSGLIWFWPGRPDMADPDRIFRFDQDGDPSWERVDGAYTLFPASFESIAENLVDPAHTSFVHQRTIGGSDATDVALDVEQDRDRITVGRWVENSAPVPVMSRYVNFAGQVDRWQYYHFHLPHISVVDMGAVDAGTARDAAFSESRYRTVSCAVLTPETESSTHYFWFVWRTFALGDERVSDEMRHAYAATFDEDRSLLGSIQANQTGAQLGSVRLAIDKASIRVSRALQHMAEEEAAAALASLASAESSPGEAPRTA